MDQSVLNSYVINVMVDNSRTNQHDNPGMMSAEQTNCRKHEDQYSHTGCSSVAFVAHVLVPWGHPPSDICGFWLCWN